MPHTRPKRAEKEGSKFRLIIDHSCYIYWLWKELGQVFIAKQKYDAIGNRSNRVLSFEKGEELEVLAPNPGSEWWEVNIVITIMQD